MKAQSFYRRVLIEAGRPSLAEAKRATAAVLHILRDRLTPSEADQAAAQLPRPLKLLWWDGEVEGRRPVKLHRKEFYGRVQAEAGLASEREARFVTQLPKDLKSAWEDA